MPQQHQQEIQQIHHSLSRLALAKAMKTPDDCESEPWQKSVIFSQPFIRELHSRKQQLYANPPPRQEKSNGKKSPTKHPRKNRSSSSSIEKRLSELSIKKSVDAKPTRKPRSFLPSDSEEEEENEDAPDEDEEEDEDDLDSLLQAKELQRPESSSQGKLRPTSLNSSRDDISTPSRGSMSSNTLPLTDEDEVDPAPTAPLHHIRSNSWALPTSDSSLYNGPQQKTPYTQNSNMIDPMYYQRYQQYQQQLQYQIQYQQALALQHQQQQQMYMFSQNPNGFYPPSVMEDPASLSHTNKRHSGGYSQQQGKSNGGHKMSKTDIRRREEMMRSSNESNHRLHPQQQAMYYQQPLPFTPSIMKSNTRRPSYNL